MDTLHQFHLPSSEGRLCRFAPTGPEQPSQGMIQLDLNTTLRQQSKFASKVQEIADRRIGRRTETGFEPAYAAERGQVLGNVCDENKWLEYFKKPGTNLGIAKIDDLPGSGPSEQSSPENFWPALDFNDRKEMLLAFVDNIVSKDGLAGAAGVNQVQQSAQKIRASANLADLTNAKNAVLYIFSVRDIQLGGRGATTPLLGAPPAGPTVDVLNAEARTAASLGIRELFLDASLRLSPRAKNEFKKAMDDLGVDGRQRFYDAFEPPPGTPKNGFDLLPSCLLKGAMVFDAVTGAPLPTNALTSEHVRELIRNYKARESAENTAMIEAKQQRARLAERIGEDKPKIHERLLENFREMEGWQKWLFGGLAAYVAFKSTGLLFNKDEKGNTSPNFFGFAAIGVAGLFGLGGKDLFKGTFIGDFCDSAADLMSSNGKAGKVEREVWKHGDIEVLQKYLEENLVKDVRVQELATSIVLAKVPLKTLAQHFRQRDNFRGGKLEITGDLEQQVAQLAGIRAPENETLMNHIRRTSGKWGDSLAHVFYLIGLEKSAANRSKHVNLIGPDANRNGSFRDMTNPEACREYARIAQEGLSLASNMDMNLADFMRAAVGRYEEKAPTTEAPTRDVGWKWNPFSLRWDWTGRGNAPVGHPRPLGGPRENRNIPDGVLDADTKKETFPENTDLTGCRIPSGTVFTPDSAIGTGSDFKVTADWVITEDITTANFGVKAPASVVAGPGGARKLGLNSSLKKGTILKAGTIINPAASMPTVPAGSGVLAMKELPPAGTPANTLASNIAGTRLDVFPPQTVLNNENTLPMGVHLPIGTVINQGSSIEVTGPANGAWTYIGPGDKLGGNHINIPAPMPGGVEVKGWLSAGSTLKPGTVLPVGFKLSSQANVPALLEEAKTLDIEAGVIPAAAGGPDKRKLFPAGTILKVANASLPAGVKLAAGTEIKGATTAFQVLPGAGAGGLIVPAGDIVGVAPPPAGTDLKTKFPDIVGPPVVPRIIGTLAPGDVLKAGTVLKLGTKISAGAKIPRTSGDITL